MKALHDNVVVEETLTRKISSSIIVPGQEQEADKTVYEPTYKVIAVGPQAEDKGVSIGDIPVIGTWATAASIKVVSGKAGETTIIRHIVHSVTSIVALD